MSPPNWPSRIFNAATIVSMSSFAYVGVVFREPVMFMLMSLVVLVWLLVIVLKRDDRGFVEVRP